MKLKTVLSALLLGVFGSFSAMQAQYMGPASWDAPLERSSFLAEQTKLTALDSLSVWQERVLLHTDKNQLPAKDVLFFKANVLTGPKHLRVSASDVLKVELLQEDGTLVDSQYHKIQNGNASGSLQLPKKIAPGTYYLRAYTRWMLNYGPENFAQKRIQIVGKTRTGSKALNATQNLEFFPEGGTMVSGMENRIAVRYEGTPLQGAVIIDNAGKTITQVQDYGEGVASFILNPSANTTYQLQFPNAKKVALPKAGTVGYGMQVNNLADDKVVVKITASEALKKEPIVLRGRVNGVTSFETDITFAKNSTAELEIPKSSLPNGIIQLQLEDGFDQIWAQRLLHIDNNEVQFSVEKQTDAVGDFLAVTVTDKTGAPVSTELSLAITKPMGKTVFNDNVGGLRYQRYLNDLLVLTGQRPENDALDHVTALPTEIKYNFQEGLEFYGRAYDLDAVPLPNTKIQVVLSGEGDAIAKEVTTNEDGLFKLTDLQIDGEAAMVFRREANEQRDRFVKVVPYEYETPPLAVLGATQESEGLSSRQFIPKKQVREFNKDEEMERLITLEGVTLVGEKLKVKRKPSYYGLEPARRVVQDPERPKTIPQLFLNIPGVQVSNLGNLNPTVILPKAAGTGPVLWVIDGIPLTQDFEVTPLADVMSLIPFIDVDRIEILFGPQAAMYGTRGSGGVIMVYTRDGSDENYFNRKKAQLWFEGYHDSLNFEAYKEMSSSRKNRVQGPTLYWNPSVTTNEEGMAIIRLPEMLEEEVLELDINTVTTNGDHGRLKTTLNK